MSDVVFVDVGTTGLDPDRHEIWEAALVYKSSRGWESEMWRLPVDLGRADPKALAVSRFHERKGGVHLTDPGVFAARFARLTRGKHLAGAVVSFDEERLRKFLRAWGACPEWHYHLIDVEALAAGALAEGTRRVGLPVGITLPWDSEDLSRSIGVNPDDFDRHTALGDARWAKAIYEKVAG